MQCIYSSHDAWLVLAGLSGNPLLHQGYGLTEEFS